MQAASASGTVPNRCIRSRASSAAARGSRPSRRTGHAAVKRWLRGAWALEHHDHALERVGCSPKSSSARTRCGPAHCARAWRRRSRSPGSPSRARCRPWPLPGSREAQQVARCSDYMRRAPPEPAPAASSSRNPAGQCGGEGERRPRKSLTAMSPPASAIRPTSVATLTRALLSSPSCCVPADGAAPWAGAAWP